METPSSDAGERQRLDAFCEVAAQLGSPIRLELLAQLAGGPRSVGDLRQTLRLEQALVSHHLGKLREAGLTTSKRRGRCIFYKHAPGVRVVNGPDGPAIVIRAALGEIRFAVDGVLGRTETAIEFKPEGKASHARRPPRTA